MGGEAQPGWAIISAIPSIPCQYGEVQNDGAEERRGALGSFPVCPLGCPGAALAAPELRELRDSPFFASGNLKGVFFPPLPALRSASDEGEG